MDYHQTGFQSPCAEFAEKPLSLDERYLTNRPSLFIIEVSRDSRPLDVKKGDKLLIDRSLCPREGQLVLLIINNEFALKRYSKNLLMGQDPDTGDCLWGVSTALIRENP